MRRFRHPEGFRNHRPKQVSLRRGRFAFSALLHGLEKAFDLVEGPRLDGFQETLKILRHFGLEATRPGVEYEKQCSYW